MTSLPIRPGSTFVTAAAVAALSLTACGAQTTKSTTSETTKPPPTFDPGATVNPRKIETGIVKQFAHQGIRVAHVRCKDEIEARVGTAINCTALNEKKTTLVIKGKVTSLKRGNAHFDVKAVSAIAKGPTIAAEVSKILANNVHEKPRSVTCPTAVPIPTTPSVICELIAPNGKTYDTTVTIDAKDNLHAQVADTPKN